MRRFTPSALPTKLRANRENRYYRACLCRMSSVIYDSLVGPMNTSPPNSTLAFQHVNVYATISLHATLRLRLLLL